MSDTDSNTVTAAGTTTYQAASYDYPAAQELADVFAGRAPGHIYTRISNPTTLALERRLAELEGGIGCIATSSGMAATTAVMIGLLRSGDEIVTASGIFGGTLSLFKNILSRFGVKTVLADAGEPIRNVPGNFAEQGQEVVSITPAGERFALCVRRKK